MEWALGAAAAPALALVDEPLELLLLPQPAATMTLDVSSVRTVGACAEPAPNDPAQLWEVSTHITVHNASAP